MDFKANMTPEEFEAWIHSQAARDVKHAVQVYKNCQLINELILKGVKTPEKEKHV